ncbi:MAG: SAM-dependent methyltransferase [Phycisphaera sp. RhM]|nr:SAM-dependent methyltransferase [Phycisphaera sp. RhM]
MNRSRKPRRPRTGSLESKDPPPTPKKPQKRRPQKLRIIGGSMRGRTVVYHGAEFTRPMKDSVRESLFNIIGPRIKGSKSYDLFAGTGAVAFESLSRGASSAIAIEKNRRAHAFLESTAETLGVASKITILYGDAFRLGSSLLGPADPDAPLDDTPRIIYLCPPYAMWETAAESLQGLIRLATNHSPPGSLIVAETDKHYDESKLPPGQWDHRLYGGTRLSLLEPPMICGMRM